MTVVEVTLSLDGRTEGLFILLLQGVQTSAGPHTCGAATKFLRVACARSWGAPRTVSPALPRSTSPRPTRGSRSCADGAEGTGEELPSAAAPPLSLWKTCQLTKKLPLFRWLKNYHT